MRRSFYRNLILIIGGLVAIETLLQLGIKKAIIPIIADIIITLILIILIYNLEPSAPIDPNKIRHPIEDSQKQNIQLIKWQKQHDQWWANHKSNNKNAL